jgi:hypothetical protein
MRDLAAQPMTLRAFFQEHRAPIYWMPRPLSRWLMSGDMTSCGCPSNRLVAALGLAAKGVRCAGGTVE